MKEYKLPEEWYIEITDENKQILNDWKIQQPFNQPIDSYKSIKYVTYNGCGAPVPPYEAASKITTEQFIQYVLKQDVFPKNWVIKINEDNLKIVHKWLNHNNYNLKHWSCVYSNGKANDIVNMKEGYTEITTTQFIKHVLKEKENYNYSKLINILKFIDESSRM